MKITVLTLFPEMFTGILENSIIKRAIAAGVVEIKLVNIRDYTTDKYGRVDSAPVGGGAGLQADQRGGHAGNSSTAILVLARGKQGTDSFFSRGQTPSFFREMRKNVPLLRELRHIVHVTVFAVG